MSGIKIHRTDALIAVDVQPTFMPGGGLAVAGGDEIVDAVNQLLHVFDRAGGILAATLDRHPRGHISLASSYSNIAPMVAMTENIVSVWDENRHRIAPHAKFSIAELKAYLSVVGSQMLWPDHAIEGEIEADIHPALYGDDDFDFVQVKGMDPKCDSYSGFFDNLGRRTGMDSVLSSLGTKRIFICGLAFDFCVGWTALDARKALPNAEVFVIEDVTRSVNMPGTVSAMRTKLTKAGVRLIHVNDIEGA